MDNLSNATNKFVAGDYQAARDAYSSLGDYKDSSARVLLCDAMIDLQEGRPEDAAVKLDQLTSEGQGDIAKHLADALLPVVSDWKAKGLTPQALLILLGKADIIDPQGTLDNPLTALTPFTPSEEVKGVKLILCIKSVVVCSGKLKLDTEGVETVQGFVVK